jgi:hypothetical protein
MHRSRVAEQPGADPPGPSTGDDRSWLSPAPGRPPVSERSCQRGLPEARNPEKRSALNRQALWGRLSAVQTEGRSSEPRIGLPAINLLDGSLWTGA